MRVLTFTTLYPNAIQPRHGIFIENRLREFVRYSGAQCRVVAPVPWFPVRHARFGQYAQYAQVPRRELRHGITIDHPRYGVIPKVGMTLAPFFLAMSAARWLKKLEFEFDVIDAHYFYPDGVAAVLLGQRLRKPVVISARGSDLNLIPNYALPRRMIQWAAQQADGLITVCESLKERLTMLGISAERVTVLRNGVDLSVFQPVLARDALRAKLGMHTNTLLSVGNLVALKGHDLAIAALAQLPDYHLMIAGDGPDKENLQRSAVQHGVQDRVQFLGTLSQAELAEYYAGADALVLLSSREGWANVLLESMACGTPVIATAVGGTPEVVRSPQAGLLVERTVSSIVAGIQQMFAQAPARAATRAYAEGFGWVETSQGLLRLFEQVIARDARNAQ